MTDLVLGVDPGLDGALAFIERESGRISAVLDMPTHTVQVNSVARRTLDVYAIARVLDVYGAATKLAVLEEPHALPKQGVSSAFTFGRVFGEVHGLIAGNFIRTLLERPAKWKRAMGLSHDKDESRRMATRLWPEHAETFGRKKDDGRAEAALLAQYGRTHRSSA